MSRIVQSLFCRDCVEYRPRPGAVTCPAQISQRATGDSGPLDKDASELEDFERVNQGLQDLA